jgi:WD40 repeat protein
VGRDSTSGTVSDGQTVYTSLPHKILCLSFHPGGTSFAIGCSNGTLELMSTSDFSPLATHTAAHEGSVSCVSFVGNGDVLVSGGSDGMVRRWDADLIDTLTVGDHVLSLDVDAEGDILVAGTQRSGAFAWRLKDFVQEQHFTGHIGSVSAVAVSRENPEVIATGGVDTTVRLWELASGYCLVVLEGHQNWVSAVSFHPTGRYIYTASYDDTVRVWSTDGDVVTGGRILRGHVGHVYCIASSPDATIIATGSWDNSVRVWNAVETETFALKLCGHSDMVLALAFSPCGLLLGSGSADGTVRLWRPRGGVCVVVLNTQSNSMKFVSFSPSGILMTGYSSGETYLWDVEAHLRAFHFEAEVYELRANVAKLHEENSALKLHVEVLSRAATGSIEHPHFV